MGTNGTLQARGAHGGVTTAKKISYTSVCVCVCVCVINNLAYKNDLSRNRSSGEYFHRPQILSRECFHILKYFLNKMKRSDMRCKHKCLLLHLAPD